jgi:hypothetical protein
MFLLSPAMGTHHARHGIAIASSVMSKGYPKNAIDGKPDGLFRHGSCTQTAKEYAPSWKVYFPKLLLVREVVITNRADCCGKYTIRYIATLVMCP